MGCGHIWWTPNCAAGAFVAIFFLGVFTVGEVPISTSFHRKVHLLEQGGAQVVPLHPAMEDSWGDGGGNMWKP